ncbi:MAG: S8 family serine peptidase [Actinomycetota bacterium]|nr:S8 family serine peptidase [Actinomycetota bacterium]
MYRAALAAALFTAGIAVAAPAASRVAAEGGTSITDPRLLSEIAAATARRTEGGSEPTVPVEVLTADAAGATAAVLALGGKVTGEVPGSLVQARMPVSSVAALAGTAGVTRLQYPQRAGYVPKDGGRPQERPTRIQSGPGFGNPGNEVSITNADDWQAAGLDGTGVKVGIVDYFDMTRWNPTEHGPAPTLANGRMFCQDTLGVGMCTIPIGGSIVNDTLDGEHGVAVSEIVKDMAPGAELYIASVATTADLQAAVNWFKTKGVTILTRSLGSPYDGPGDGTGPLAAVVNSAVEQGITWFNSAGNDAVDAYVKRSVPTNLAGNGYVDFDASAGTDTWLRLDGECILLDGIRWANDWYLPTAQKTDYSVEFWEPTSDISGLGDTYNPTPAQVTAIDVFDNPGVQGVVDDNQRLGANPLEAADLFFCPQNIYGDFGGISYIRVKRNAATSVGATPDTLEVALAAGLTELLYYDTPGSAAKSVVDSRNAGMLAVGAVDPAAGTTIGWYSSQGPTTDGRIKPDISAPSCLNSTIYGNPPGGDCELSNLGFAGTSAASPVAAGMAAVLQSAGLATGAANTAALVKHFTTDLGAAGPDNVFGAGKVLLPAPPPAVAAPTPGKYIPLASPQRILDTRPVGHVGPPSLTGPYATSSIIEMTVLNTGGVPASGVSAVAINLTSVGSTSVGFLQALPYLRAAVGGTSTLNISTVGPARPNFAIVPVGVDGKISVYIQAGGNVLIDVLGYFADGQVSPTTNGRFVPLASPERWMDTRGLGGAPLPAIYGGIPRPANAGETILVPTLGGTAVPGSGVDALVVNVASAASAGGGFLQIIPTGTVGATHSNVNYNTTSASANTAIVPLGTGNQISVFTSQSTHMLVDVVGYITDNTAATDTYGLFLPITPGRAYDTRLPTPNPFTAGQTRTATLAGLVLPTEPHVPVGAVGVSANLTVVAPGGNGNLKVYPSAEPSTSSVNFAAGKTVANGALLALNGNDVTAKMSQSGHLLIDINGYFLGGVG